MDAATESDILRRLDPALRHLVQARTDLSLSLLGVVRDSLNQRRGETARQVNTAGVEIEERAVRSIPVRIYRGASAQAPAVIYCHSGAFIARDRATGENFDEDVHLALGARPRLGQTELLT